MTLRVVAHASNGPVRWLVAPAALLAAAVNRMFLTVAEPGMPRMSNEWLLSHEQLVGRRCR
jgi:hypothetical protein